MIFYFGSSLFSGGKDRIPYGTPQVVIVTVLDDATMSEQYRERVVENREYYAEMQGRQSPSTSFYSGTWKRLTSIAPRLWDLLS